MEITESASLLARKMAVVETKTFFIRKAIKGLQHNLVCSEEKPQLERQLAHAQTIDRGVASTT